MIRARLGMCDPSGLTGYQFDDGKFSRGERNRASSAGAVGIERGLPSTVKLECSQLRTDRVGPHVWAGSSWRWVISEKRDYYSQARPVSDAAGRASRWTSI